MNKREAVERGDWTWRDTMGTVALFVMVVAILVGLVMSGVAGIGSLTWWAPGVCGIVAGAAFLTMIVSFGLIFAHDKKETLNG